MGDIGKSRSAIPYLCTGKKAASHLLQFFCLESHRSILEKGSDFVFHPHMLCPLLRNCNIDHTNLGVAEETSSPLNCTRARSWRCQLLLCQELLSSLGGLPHYRSLLLRFRLVHTIVKVLVEKVDVGEGKGDGGEGSLGWAWEAAGG